MIYLLVDKERCQAAIGTVCSCFAILEFVLAAGFRMMCHSWFLKQRGATKAELHWERQAW